MRDMTAKIKLTKKIKTLRTGFFTQKNTISFNQSTIKMHEN